MITMLYFPSSVIRFISMPAKSKLPSKIITERFRIDLNHNVMSFIIIIFVIAVSTVIKIAVRVHRIWVSEDFSFWMMDVSTEAVRSQRRMTHLSITLREILVHGLPGSGPQYSPGDLLCLQVDLL